MAKRTMAVMVVLWLAAGCGGESNPCAAAAQHLEQCSGIPVQAPETCNPERADFVLGVPCARLGNARGTFTSWGFYDDWGYTDADAGLLFSDFLGSPDQGDVAFQVDRWCSGKQMLQERADMAIAGMKLGGLAGLGVGILVGALCF